MTIRDKLRATLQTAGAMCDDCLSSSSAVKPRQTVNARCRELESAGELTRQRDLCPRCRTSKIVNRLKSGSKDQTVSLLKKIAPQEKNEKTKPWYWEGNVQAKIVEYLESMEWEILTSANTATREAGKDIVAIKEGKELWISVKGWPEKSVNVQARHWFSGALFDLVLYKDQNPDVQLAIGLPSDFITYKNLIPRVSWLRKNLPFQIITVSEEGKVKIINPQFSLGGL